MWRRKPLWVVVVGLVVVLAIGTFVQWPEPNRITKENFRQIKKGMSLAEVVSILGPPGDYRTGETETEWLAPYEKENTIEVEDGGPFIREEWQSDTAEVWILLDTNSTLDALRMVNCGSFSVQKRIEQTPFDNLLWRVKRQWHRWFS
jgi:hypothetical protein